MLQLVVRRRGRQTWFGWLLGCLLAATSVLAVPGAADAAPPTKTKGKSTAPPYPRIEPEFVVPVGGDDSPLKIGGKISLALATGKRAADVELLEIAVGKEPNTLKTLSVTNPATGRKQLVQLSQIASIENGDARYDVVLDSEKKLHVLIDRAKRDAEVTARLQSQNRRLWAELTDEQQEAAIATHKQFLERVGEVYKKPQFSLHETKYFLFYTDMPPQQIGIYIAYLDGMYDELCKAFGVPKDKNIWLGKCVVVAFVEREAFLEFERTMMNNPDAGNAQGLCHSYSDGRVVMACFRGSDPAVFAHLLVHETSHGFLHRLRSSVHVPSWVNEGVAEWVGAAVVRASKTVQRRQAAAVTMMQQTGSIGGDFLNARQIQSPQYGVASHLTNFMLTTDPARYRGFIMSIKEGRDWEESLQHIYGISVQELIVRYGQSFGVAQLRP